MARRFSALAVLVLAAVPLSGCAIATAIAPDVTQNVYATPGDAAHVSGGLALPSWIPGEATMIRVKNSPSQNATIMTYTMPGPPAPIGQPCTADQMAKKPRLDDTWWMQSTPTDGVYCTDDWHIWYNSVQVFAWKS